MIGFGCAKAAYMSGNVRRSNRRKVANLNGLSPRYSNHLFLS